MIRFLGSIYFALILIAISAVGVIAGTIIESKIGSHEAAVDWIYGNPLFYLLLICYFINILLSALSRWPFQGKHVPFLITHLGLLMVIAGVFMKGLFGIQGEMRVIEGTYTNDLILKNQKALAVYTRDGFASYPIAKGRVHIAEDSPLKVKLIKEAPNGEEKLLAAGKEFKKSELKKYVVYDEGYEGYAALMESEIERERAIDQALKEELQQAVTSKQELSPPLAILEKGLKEQFAENTVQFLRGWKNQGEWLYTTDARWLLELPWNLLPPDDFAALYWIQELFSKVHSNELLATFPFPEAVKQDESSITGEIWLIKEALPAQNIGFMTAELSGKLLSAYLRVYGIHLDTLPLPDVESPLIEEPLRNELSLLAPSSNPEENRAVIDLLINEEKISLLYDPVAEGLKWPLKDKKHLVRFEPHRIPLPFSIELHGARDIKYPGSEQTKSYECDLTLREKGKKTLCTLSMNEVHETPSGYRLYLAGIGPLDSYGVKQVHLVVNKDPAKYVLTYPGGALVSLGILLLFFRKRR